MPPYGKIAFPVIGALVFAALSFVMPQARSEGSPPQVVAEELKQARTDLTAGGIRMLSNNWYACIDQARASQDANAAERCVVYGYGALLLGSDPAAAASPWMRHLTADIVAPGQMEMLGIMGIPAAPRQAWLERYRRWVSEAYTPESGASDAGGPVFGAPVVRPAVMTDGQTNLAKVAEGKYPAEALRDHDIAEALRKLLGPSVLARLKDYSFGSPMESTGRYTTGVANEPRGRGPSEARFVFSPDTVWVGLIDGRRMRIYGDPPQPARALLLRGRNETTWRGIIEDMSHPMPPPLVPVADSPHPNGLSPRMTILPHFLPISAEPAPLLRPESDATEVRLRDLHGTLVVPVLVNNTVTVPFTVDSGASDVSISTDIMRKLMDAGTLTQADFLGKQVYHLADGARVTSETFRLHALKVGDREVRDVLASVTNDAESLLLGQSFLTRFRSWSIDNQRQVLLLK